MSWFSDDLTYYAIYLKEVTSTMSQANEQHLDAFQKLCSLVGRWADVNNPVFVEYRKSANGSVLVETWTWPRKNIEALTIYHLDDGKLIATHYCPIGNQPRLAYVPSTVDNRLTFEFVSATNLPDKRVDHCESFWFEIDGRETIARGETYEENGVAEIQQSVYQRTNDPAERSRTTASSLR